MDYQELYYKIPYRIRRLLTYLKRSDPNECYDKWGRCQFKPGQAIVFEPRWAMEKFKGGVTYRTATGEEHPLKYQDIVSYIAEHSPAYGHCIVVKYSGEVVTMLHPDDFRPATDEEV